MNVIQVVIKNAATRYDSILHYSLGLTFWTARSCMSDELGGPRLDMDCRRLNCDWQP